MLCPIWGFRYGKSLITGFARINGQPVGVFGNDSASFAGAMTADASLKVGG